MTNNKLILDLRSYDSETLCHQHDYHQLVLPVLGGMEMLVAGKGRHVTGATAAIIAAGNEHGCSTDQDNQFIVADIPVALAPELARLPEYIQMDPALSHYVNFLHEQINQDHSEKRSGSASSQRQMLLLLLQLLQERFGEDVRIDKRINTARLYLDENYAEQISIASLASIAHISERQLTELFKSQLGMTPNQYLLEKRMQTAWQKLEQSNDSIQKVAFEVGYSSQAAFSDRFKKHFGRSPKYFR